MSDNILLLHHFEPFWENELNNNGTSFDEEMDKVIDFIRFSDNDLDKVIITTFEDLELSPEHMPLIQICEENNINLEHHVYAYGMIKDPDDEHTIEAYPEDKLNETWCFGGRSYHSEIDVLDIEEWHHDLKGHNIYLAGAFEGECINDVETIFDAINIKYQKLDALCVGNCEQYEFYSEEIFKSLSNKFKENIREIEEKLENTMERRGIDDDIDKLVEKYPHVALKYFRETREVTDEFLDECEDKLSISREDVSYIDKANVSLEYEELLDVMEDVENGYPVSDWEKKIKQSMDMKNSRSPRPSLRP